MNIKIGDKIRFLNAVGGGIVRGFQGKDMVLVEDENGFDVPAFIRECVVVGEGTTQTRNKSIAPLPTPVAAEPKPEVKPEKIVETSEGELLNVFLAYLPVDPKEIQKTAYEAYFINDSNYFLFFNYMSRNNNSWTSRFNGVIEPNTQLFIEEFEKSDLNDLERLCVQFIAFKKDKPFKLKNAISVELRLDTVKFYKLHCFTDNDYFDEGAILVPVVRNDVAEREMLVSVADLEEAMMQKNREDHRKPQPIKKKKENPVLEVDLHINTLLDTTAGMSNSDMLQYQLDTFHNTLKQYAGQKGQKIVFIHGKGDGVLRKAIETELKTKYKSYYFQDASFREYGFGATMVTIR
ncbi:DUF2027 domain-containing protein [Parabacteroides sp. OttesenSCG-928-G21]|nr:DUF2027 domain-containing protein [Parabacteroides sp. OttesenSCG-928-G21]